MTNSTVQTPESFTETRRDGVLFIRLDEPGSSVNRLRPELIERFARTLETARQDPEVKGVAFLSAKADNFVAGVDLDLFRTHTTREQVEQLSRQGQEMLDRIEAFPKPVVACIHGSCMGGGTELALACRHRIVSRSPSTRIALPEVKLGLLPGMGGTQRLPRRIGLAAALPYLLTGRNMYARQARASGFADAVVQPDYLEEAAIRIIHEGPSSGSARTLRGVRFRAALQNAPLVRRAILRAARRQVERTTHGNYPAPPAILEVVEHGLAKGMEAGLRQEAAQFAELAVGAESRALLSLFFAMTAAKRNPFEAAASPVNPSAGGYGKRATDDDDPDSKGAGTGTEPYGHPENGSGDPNRTTPIVGIAGAGLMGAGIAEVSLDGGDRVVLYDLREEACRSARQAIHASLKKKHATGQIDRLEMDRRLSSLKTTTRLEDLAPCTLVIEAVVERADVKRELFESLAGLTGKETVLASNTSALPIASLFSEQSRPEQSVGMHYFSPVQKMPLIEVIWTDRSRETALREAVAAGLRQGKTPIVVRDGPGFYTTRILAPFINEALLLFEEGADVRETDRLMRRAGFPVGPFTLLDEVGLDVGAHVGDVLGQLFRSRGARTSDLSHRLMQAGILGRKSGAGFHLYDGGSPRQAGGAASGRRRGGTRKRAKSGGRPLNEAVEGFRPAERPPFTVKADEIRDRMVLMMVNEAIHCLGEGILRSPVDGDLGAILGLGFPPFLGGPFRYVDAAGPRTLHKRMTELQERNGPRFTPAPLLAEHARSGRPFHPG